MDRADHEQAARSHLQAALEEMEELRAHHGKSPAGRAIAVAITNLQTSQLWLKESTTLPDDHGGPV